MNKIRNEEKYFSLYGELKQIAREIEEYYDIDKIKPYSVYIWTKDSENDGENVFDICENEIIFYVKDHVIIDEAKPIIEKIQAKLKEISKYTNLKYE